MHSLWRWSRDAAAGPLAGGFDGGAPRNPPSIRPSFLTAHRANPTRLRNQTCLRMWRSKLGLLAVGFRESMSGALRLTHRQEASHGVARVRPPPDASVPRTALRAPHGARVSWGSSEQPLGRPRSGPMSVRGNLAGGRRDFEGQFRGRPGGCSLESQLPATGTARHHGTE